MAIEFRCTQCNKLLRTGDDTAGKRAKCPECGTIMTIPAAPAGGGPAPPPPPSGGSPFAVAGPQPSFPADSGNPYQAPSPLQRPISPRTLDMGDIFSRTWEIFKVEWGMCLVVILITGALNFGVNMISGFIPFVGFIVAILFQTWISIGQALFFLKKVRGQDAAVGDIFTGGPYFGKVLLAGFLVGAVVLGILLLCVLLPVLVGLAISKEAAVILGIVGGLIALVAIYYLMLVISQFYYLILDRDVGIIESLTMSRDLMQGNKLTLFLIWLISGVVGTALGLMTCFLGFFAVAPYLALMTWVIYLTITGQPTVEQMRTMGQSPFGSLPRMGPVQ